MKNNQNWGIKNSYAKLPSKFYSKQLPEKVINMIINKEITVGHARTLIGNPNATNLALEIKNKNLSVRESEKLLSTTKKRNKSNQKENIKSIETCELERKLSLFLNNPIIIYID